MSQTPTRHIAPVLFTCEAKGAPVPTGHRMRESEFAGIVGPRSFRCSHCGEVHTWTTSTAWLQGDPALA